MIEQKMEHTIIKHDWREPPRAPYNQEIKIVTIPNDRCVYGNGSKGFPDCHCDHCIKSIIQLEEFKKGIKYWLRGKEVEITSFCPLDNCKEIFAHKVGTGFCEWLSIKEAREMLHEVMPV